MSMFVFASLALALVLAVVALVHQVRLRRASEKLLRLLFSRWGDHEKNTEHGADDPGVPGRRDGRL